MLSHRSRSTSTKCRRGIAMMLVLISLMLATILSISYLASRDNSAAIGDNVARSAAARWAADSGLKITLAVMETDTNWRTAHPDGKLLDDYSLAGGLIDVDLLDIATKQPPTASSENIQVTAVATVNGIEQTSTALAYVPSTASQNIDLDLSEFAIFATDSIALEDNATVTRWPTAPLSSLGMPIALGTQATSSGAVGIAASAAVIDGQVYVPSGASTTVVMASNGTPIETIELGDAIPMPTTPDSAVSQPPVISLAPSLSLVGGVTSTLTNTRLSSISLSSGAKRTLQGNITVVSDTGMEMAGNARILINGNVKLVVFEELKMENAAIELMPGSTLVMYVGEGLNIKNSYIGDARSTAVMDSTGTASMLNPERVRITRVPQATSEVDWWIEGHSVVKASIYAHDVRFRMTNQSALYGRIAASEVELRDTSAVFYDPALCSRNGYTSESSVIFESDGRIKSAVKTLVNLETASLRAVANALETPVKAIDSSTTAIQPTGAVATEPAVVAPTAPTPRTVPVQFTLEACGKKISDWEK